MQSHLLNSMCSVSHRMAPSESLEEFANITVLLKLSDLMHRPSLFLSPSNVICFLYKQCVLKSSPKTTCSGFCPPLIPVWSKVVDIYEADQNQLAPNDAATTGCASK